MHCVAHRLELGAAGASQDKGNSEFGNVRQMLQLIYKHYHRSPKEMRDLKAVAEAMGEKTFRPTNLKGTRWTPHFKNALTVLLSG
jgi:hypothetical protein